MTNAKRFPADEAIHHTGQRGPMVVLASDHDAETDRLQRHLDSRNEQIDGYERQLGIDNAGAEHTIGSEIERLQKREKDLMDVIDSRDRALGFVPLDEMTSHEPKVGETFPAFMYCPTCGQLYTGRGGQDGYPMMLTCPNHHTWQDPRPVEGASRDEPLEQRSDLAKAVRLFIFAAKRDNWPVVTHGYFTRMEAALLDVTTEGASRDASSGSNAWADAKGGLPDNKL